MAAILIDPECKMHDPEFRKQFAAAVLIHTARILMKREGRELTSTNVRWLTDEELQAKRLERLKANHA